MAIFLTDTILSHFLAKLATPFWVPDLCEPLAGQALDLAYLLLTEVPENLLSTNTPSLTYKRGVMCLYQRSVYDNGSNSVGWVPVKVKMVLKETGHGGGYLLKKRGQQGYLQVMERRTWQGEDGWRRHEYLLFEEGIPQKNNSISRQVGHGGILVHYFLPREFATLLQEKEGLQNELNLIKNEFSQLQESLNPTKKISYPLQELVIFSGGTAVNPFAKELARYTPRVAYILPVSDDGGSSYEIRRVLGGPSIGDIRSRCLRLSTSKEPGEYSIHCLLSHRLHPTSQDLAIHEWDQFTQGTHPLYSGIHPHLKHIIKKYLLFYNNAVISSSLKGIETPFDFRNGSMGNFFFSGLRIFFSCLESAIFLFSRVLFIPPENSVIPIITMEKTVSIGVELENGKHVRGQNQISHPPVVGDGVSGTLVDKSRTYPPLEAKVRRVYYLNEYGQEFVPPTNPNVVRKMVGGVEDGRDGVVVVFGMGSVFTSLVPCLVLPGIGETIATKKTPKLLFLNGTMDRETHGMTAADVIRAVTWALNRGTELNHPPQKYITHIFYTLETELKIDPLEIGAMGISHVIIPGQKKNPKFFDTRILVQEVFRMIQNEGEKRANL